MKYTPQDVIDGVDGAARRGGSRIDARSGSVTDDATARCVAAILMIAWTGVALACLTMAILVIPGWPPYEAVPSVVMAVLVGAIGAIGARLEVAEWRRHR